MNGPVNLYLNTDKKINNYLIVKLPETGDFVNAKITVISGKAKFYKENIQGGIGFGSDSNNGNIHFGLGKLTAVDRVEIVTLQDKKHILKNPKINSIIQLKVV